MQKTVQDHFVRPDNPMLRRIAALVPKDEIVTLKTERDIERMLNVAYGEQADRSKSVLAGLAAPQIGISKRIILVDTAAEGHGESGNLRVYINPEILWRSEDLDEWYEGCYSTDRVCGIVRRPRAIRIRAFDPEGSIVEEDHHGYTARIFLHEIDHLNGREFVAHITKDENLHWVEDDEFPAYRDKENWRHWPKKCPRVKWHIIKGVHESPELAPKVG